MVNFGIFLCIVHWFLDCPGAMQMALQRMNFVVAVAASGEEVLQRYAAGERWRCVLRLFDVCFTPAANFTNEGGVGKPAPYNITRPF